MSTEDTFDAWWREALCAEVGESLFFVRPGESVEEAKAVCALCTVRHKCLADALRSGVQYGVFGGFSRNKRAVLSAAVEAGHDPMTVAKRAIARDTNTKRSPSWMS